MRESTQIIGAPVLALANGQGNFPREGVGAGPGTDHAPDQGDLGEGLNLEDLAPG